MEGCVINFKYKNIIFILAIFIASCLRKNVFQDLEIPFTVEEKVVLAMDKGDYDRALALLYSLFKPPALQEEIRDPNVSALKKRDILISNFALYKNGDRLLALFAQAAIGSVGLDIKGFVGLMAITENASASDLINRVLSFVNANPNANSMLETVVLLNSLKDAKTKEPSELVSNIVTTLFSFAVNIAMFDKEGDHAIDAKDIANIPDHSAKSLNDKVKILESLSAYLVQKDDNPTYKKAQYEVAKIVKEIEQLPEKTIEDKMRTYLAKKLLGNDINAFMILKRESKIIFSSKPNDYRRSLAKVIVSKKQKDSVKKKMQLYLSLAELDSWGWIQDTKCDGLLFNSLYVVAGAKVKIEDARDISGKWYRHPAKDCYPRHQSGTSISRDMLIGLAFYIFEAKRLDLVTDLIRYGDAHKDSIGQWVMGEGRSSNSYLVPLSMQDTFHAIKAVLSGKLYNPKTELLWLKSQGYEAHLLMLHLYLNAKLSGGFTEEERLLIEKIHKEEPNNALFSAIHARTTDGDMKDAMRILLDKEYFPDQRLPSSRDHCEFYLWQRSEVKNDDPNPDWLACPKEAKVFSGVDFLFAAAMALGDI